MVRESRRKAMMSAWCRHDVAVDARDSAGGGRVLVRGRGAPVDARETSRERSERGAFRRHAVRSSLVMLGKSCAGLSRSSRRHCSHHSNSSITLSHAAHPFPRPPLASPRAVVDRRSLAALPTASAAPTQPPQLYSTRVFAGSSATRRAARSPSSSRVHLTVTRRCFETIILTNG